MPRRRKARRVAHHLRRDRVEVDVGNELQQVSLVLDKLRLVAALPKWPAGPGEPVVALPKSRLDERHRSTERYRASSHRNVVVIGHHAPGKNCQAVAIPSLPQELDEPRDLGPLAEHGPTACESVVYMVDRPFDNDPRPTWHAPPPCY
jgi:hypothetical protein